MEVILVRHDNQNMPTAARGAVAVLVQYVGGLGAANARRWERFLYGLLDLEPGETVTVRTLKPRVGWFHRKHMALEQALFEAQEVFEDFAQFRDWLKIGGGLCDYFPGARGLVAVPRSIAWDKMEEDEFREFDDNLKAFLRAHGCAVLWPRLRPAAQLQAVERILSAFERPMV